MRYEARIAWTGSTGLGWEDYDRGHVAAAPPATQEVRLTTGESKGDPSLLNPEQLVVMAASSCQMLWFLHRAAKARVDVVAYEDVAEATMPGKVLERIVLRPVITVAGEFREERVQRLVGLAHRECNIANSLRCPVEVRARVEAHLG